MTIGQWLKIAQAKFIKSDGNTAKLDALVLLEHVTKEDRAWLLAHPEYELAANHKKRLLGLVKKRVQGIPVAYLTGVKEFYGLGLKVNKNVLIPRPETEAMVEIALNTRLDQAEVIDVGTGCGAIAIAIAKHRPQWQVSATDISPAALAVARQNAAKHKVKVTFYKSDLFKNLPAKTFDIVCANLPYLKNDAELSVAGNQEPAVALRAGNDGLDIYRRFFAQLPSHLKPQASVVIESDPWQHPVLIGLATEVGLKTHYDERFALAFTQNSVN